MIEPTDDNIEELAYVFLDGFTSGASTMIYNTGMFDEKTAEALAQTVAIQTASDVMAMEAIRMNIRDRLEGKDGHSYVIRPKGAADGTS